jgi:RNA polymerase-binding transcription factor
MVRKMATTKRKSATAASKKPAAKKKVAPVKKPVAAKKVVARKPHKGAKAPAHKKAAAARKPVKVAKPQKSAKKVVSPKKGVAKKATAVAKPVKHVPVKVAPVKTAKAVTPAKPLTSVKPVAQKAISTSKKGKMAAVPNSKDTITHDDGRYALPSTTVVQLPPNYRPQSREEYMGPRQLAYFRAKLQKWREDLVEESKQTIDNLREEVRDVGDEAERATRETENSLELRTRDRYRKLIAKIDKALKRIEEGRYGFCEETDEEIGIERLEARPIATLCLDAQERWEHRQKQMGD